MSISKKYNIGLDIGVASVGWAVTDENGNLIKRQNKNLWGSRLFSEADTAAERRAFRSMRRRIERRKERINMLQSLLQDDMESIYPNFFQRLRNSDLIYSDKNKNLFKENYNLFDEDYFNDESYYGKFPTIYHLRNELLHNSEKMDFRLVYLALHHIIKYRGNFLYEGDFSVDTEIIKDSLQIILDYLKDTHEIVLKENDPNQILEILKNKEIAKKDKCDFLRKCFEFDKERKQIVDNLLKSFNGYKFDISKIFDIERNSTISFSSEISEEDEMIANLKECADIYEAMKNVYSWTVLQSIVSVEEGQPFNISNSFINKYEKHKKDLELLKSIYRKYYPKEYNKMFRDNIENNYVTFRGKAQGKEELKKFDAETFYKNIEKKITDLPDSCVEKTRILNDLKNENFLRKLNTTDNGAIPHQLHCQELERIIDNQSQYYKTLAENKDKILDIFNFRIPYYVGPLIKTEDKSNENHGWLIRKSDEKIRPWNIEKVIDKDLTAEEFIKRMTNKCTYLLNEDVMPRYSLLYSKFCVLNELNNIRIISEDKSSGRLDAKTKQGIINDIFMSKKKVTKKDIIEYLICNGIPCETISGLSDGTNFTSNLASYCDMKKIFGNEYSERNFDIYEELIYWITIFEDKKILKEKIKNTYKFSDDIVNKLLKLRYKGWSRLSKQLLVGEKSYTGDSIIDILEKEKLNFMQIINEPRFGFDKLIEKQLKKETTLFSYEEDIATIPTSPANKRAIWQSIGIVKELKKVMGCEPSKIYIEFARGSEEKSLKDKRTKKLLKKYEVFQEKNKEVYENLKSVQKDKNISEKMYLYFMQNGQCMYSGKPLHFEELSLYEVDHIIPQSYIKDDSLDNKALVIRGENQRKKDSLLLEDKVINARNQYWKMLLDNSLISPTKYYRLIKRNLCETDSQKVDFVNRQLVETRQITKYVTNILKNHYQNTEIFTIRANVVSDIRKKYGFYKNRNVNDFHHAHDAYLLSVVGNIIDKNLQYKDEYKYGEYIKKYFKENKTADTTKKGDGILVGMVCKHIESEKIKKILSYKDCYLSRMLEEGTGDFYHQTIYKRKEGLIRKKENLPTEIYGGYSNEFKAYMTIYGYKDKKGKQKYNLIGIPVKVSFDIKNKKITLEEYIKNEYLKDVEFTDFKVVKSKLLLKQEFIDENQNNFRLVSNAEISSSKVLILDYELNKFIYLINKEKSKITKDEENFIEERYEIVFYKLMEILREQYLVFNSITEKILAKKNVFSILENSEKKTVINEIVKLMGYGQGNLKLLGLTDREGRMSKKNFTEKNLPNMTFIDKSITGIYERRYKINGVENGTSK